MAEHRWGKLLYHHSRSLEHSYPNSVNQIIPLLDGELDESFHRSYKWLESEVGFYPLFMAVGSTDHDVCMTGYQQQWERNHEKNFVLFSYEEMPKDGVFVDYVYWHLVLNSGYNDYKISSFEKRLIFKYSYSSKDWLRKATRDPHSVQLVVPSLDLTKANGIFVRSEKTKQEVLKRGFNNPVESRRITVYR